MVVGIAILFTTIIDNNEAGMFWCEMNSRHQTMEGLSYCRIDSLIDDGGWLLYKYSILGRRKNYGSEGRCGGSEAGCEFGSILAARSLVLE